MEIVSIRKSDFMLELLGITAKEGRGCYRYA